MSTRRILLSLVLALTAPAKALDDWQPLPSGEMDRIAFGSCAKQWEPQPIWDGIAAAEPDLFLFLGDAIYGDWHGDQPFIPTAQSLRADWAKLGAQPGFQALRNRVPMLATWDNHDYGSHDGGAGSPLKETARGRFSASSASPMTPSGAEIPESTGRGPSAPKGGGFRSSCWTPSGIAVTS